MEVRVGEWYLCADYIDEPVQIRSVESNRIEVNYLISGKLKWLGYPKIWQACKPVAITFDLSYDPAERSISLLSVEGGEPPRKLTLAQLRSAYLPKSARRAPAPAPQPKPRAARPPVPAESFSFDWSGEPEWALSESESEDDYETESED